MRADRLTETLKCIVNLFIYQYLLSMLPILCAVNTEINRTDSVHPCYHHISWHLYQLILAMVTTLELVFLPTPHPICPPNIGSIKT